MHPILKWLTLFLVFGVLAVVVYDVDRKVARRSKAAKPCEVTWYRAKDYTVAVNPRHTVPDGAYIKFTNKATAPERIVIVRKRGHMKPGAKADFDLCPEAFEQLAPLSDGRLKQVEWQIVFP
jgi:hypothetical protein